MNIKVIREDLRPYSHRLGGECARANLEISIDINLPIREQRALVIHAIIENYFRSIPHDKVDELEELITEALDQLE